MKSFKKKKRSILLGIISCVIAFNIVWLINYCRYYKYVKVLGKNELNQPIFVDEDKCTYSAFYPYYLGFTGNLAICDFRPSDLKSGDTLVDMIIWPKPFSKHCEVGITIEKVTDAKRHESDMQYTNTSYCFNLDERMQLVGSYSKDEEDLYNQNLSIIELYYKKANKMWGVLENGNNLK